MRFARTHDGKGMVVYIELEPPGPTIKSYFKVVLSYNRADALHRALTAYLTEQAPAEPAWLPEHTE